MKARQVQARSRVPTLLLTPQASPFIPLDIMASLRAVIPGAEFQVFAHSKHGLTLSHGRESAQVLQQFLRSQFPHHQGLQHASAPQ